MGAQDFVNSGLPIYNNVGITDALVFKQWRAHSFGRGESSNSGIALSAVLLMICSSRIVTPTEVDELPQ